MHYACLLNNLEAVKILLDLGATTNVKTLFGHTPCDIAVWNNNSDIVDMLTRCKNKELEKKNETLKIDNNNLINRVSMLEEDLDRQVELTKQVDRKRKKVENDLDREKNDNYHIVDENRVLKRQKIDITNEKNSLCRTNQKLESDNKTLVDERDNYLKLYNNLKDTMKK